MILNVLVVSGIILKMSVYVILKVLKVDSSRIEIILKNS